MNRSSVTTSPFQSKFAHALQAISNPLARITNPFLWFEYDAYAVTHHVTGQQMEYWHLIGDSHYKKDLDQSCANKLGRLAQGLGDNVKGTNTLFFIPKSKVPLNRTVTYVRIVCTVRPEKDKTKQTWNTCGGNLILDYPGDFSTKIYSLETFKMHLNSVISTPDARYKTMNISNMYLNAPLDRYEFMRMKLSDIPQQIIDQYSLNDIAAPDGYMYMEIHQAMYGLKQSRMLANKELKKVLAKAGYFTSQHTAGLFVHKTWSISFTLFGDDFRVKHVNKADTLHLKKTISDYYPMKSD